MKVNAIQMTKERFFCPRDWLASCQFCRPPSSAPKPKLTTHSTSEISAMTSSVERESVFSLRRKLEALALMRNRLSSQIGNENRFPFRRKSCVPADKHETNC